MFNIKGNQLNLTGQHDRKMHQCAFRHVKEFLLLQTEIVRIERYFFCIFEQVFFSEKRNVCLIE